MVVVWLFVLRASMLILLVLVSSAALSVPHALCLLATVCRALDRLLTC